MTESDPGEVRPEYTAGDVGAHRQTVGEEVPSDERLSLNVPNTRAGAREYAEREETLGTTGREKAAHEDFARAGEPGAEPQVGALERKAAGERASREPPAAGPSPDGQATGVPVSVPAGDGGDRGETGPAAGIRRRQGLVWTAGGVVAFLIVRRLLGRRAAPPSARAGRLT
ncbi:hypothetical protein Misp01_69040 [Microtetraspora sp. NBRC 13810]|uniref:hypothetical protein n=1 Tax=Microtetraspora sp. NBRC 13810 TaxID=3030990 RepID=UPI0024A13393|nr:hypothetical protein [Microtetraspora sp. NBRC 13810]GLW11776.1 hypothetical protein Misp01_69040 [Microtetraspora sp. NBRC 13810]